MRHRRNDFPIAGAGTATVRFDEMAEAIGDRAAIAVDNALLFENLQMSHRD